MSEKQKIPVDVISDVMCPWCYIGKVNLDRAIKALDEYEIEVFWRPYQLDPTLPKSGKDRKEYLENKFGGPDGARQIYDRIRQAGQDIGIDFKFDNIQVSPNTMDAHRIIRWAGGQDRETQQQVVDRLFQLYFLEGAHIGDDKILAEAAKSAGMDSAIVLDLLNGDSDKDQVQGEIDQARQLGVTGVPCFIVDRKYALMGAQPPEQIIEAVRHAANERKNQDQ